MSDTHTTEASKENQFFWTGEDCPHCDDGTLEQKERFNVICGNCMEFFEHRKDGSRHYLHQTDRGEVMGEPRTKRGG